MPRKSLGKTAIAGKGSYGRINKHIFGNIKANILSSSKMVNAYKHKRKRAGKHDDYGLEMLVKPDVLLVNPIEKMKHDLQLFLGKNLSFVIRDRVLLDEIGPDEKEMGPFFNTGGMWRGFDVVERKTYTEAAFFKSSYSAGVIEGYTRWHPDRGLKELKKIFRNRRRKSLSGTKVIRIGRVRGWDPNVRNRKKAQSAQDSRKMEKAARGRDILEPTHSEFKYMLEYMQKILTLRTMIGDVSGVPKKLRSRRAKRLVDALGPVKMPRVNR